MITRSPFKSPQQILSSPEDSSYPQGWGEYVELLKSEKMNKKNHHRSRYGQLEIS